MKQRFIQFLKFHGIYDKYKENIKKSDMWENGRPLLIKGPDDYIAWAFFWLTVPECSSFWSYYNNLWKKEIEE